MRLCEMIAAGYFAYLLLPTATAPLSARRKGRIAAGAAGCAATAYLLSWLPASFPWNVVRDWTPGILLVAGYWLPGALFTSPNLSMERALITLDRRAFGHALRGGGFPDVPAAVRESLEVAYLCCYPLVPFTFGVLYVSSGAAVRAQRADAFWSTVLLAVFICYGLLPWIQTRPPRSLDLPIAATGVRRLNAVVLQHASVQVNTFPSGHVAAAVAATMAIAPYAPVAAALVGAIAVSIGVAAVVGRYHYLADVVLGAAVALFAGWTVFACVAAD